jgi:hypothetical protein
VALQGGRWLVNSLIGSFLAQTYVYAPVAIWPTSRMQFLCMIPGQEDLKQNADFLSVRGDDVDSSD